MIARRWRALSTPDGFVAYRKHLMETVLPQLRRLDGFMDLYLLSRDARDGNVRIEVMTVWSSIDSIRAFAGNDPSVAVVEPAAQIILLEYDHTVEHLDLVKGPSTSSG